MVVIWARQNVAYPNDEGTCCTIIKGAVLESTCHFPRHHVSLKNESMAPAKADAEDEASHPLKPVPYVG